MSSKSKNNTRRQSATQLGNRHLIVFLWAMCSVLHPTPPQIKAVRDEIHSVLESLRAGAAARERHRRRARRGGEHSSPTGRGAIGGEFQPKAIEELIKNRKEKDAL